MTQALHRSSQVLLLSLAFAAVDLPAQDIRFWLDRMNSAVEELSYQGTFVHVLDGNAETMRIVHRNQNGDIGERISSLDGANREIVRNGREVQCILPDQGVVLHQSPRSSSSPLNSSLPNYSEVLEQHYEFKTVPRGQVALRDTQFIRIQPRDDLRYGYTIWLDRETAMPLKSQVRDESGAVVEQILFTAFEVVDSIPESALEPTIDTAGFQAIETRGGFERQPNDEVRWQPSRLPSGFRLFFARQSSPAGTEIPVEHLVYSDGLATVSVFVADPSTEVATGFSKFGSTNAYSLTLGGRKVTAMGEVPRQTVRRIATSLESR